MSGRSKSPRSVLGIRLWLLVGTGLVTAAVLAWTTLVNLSAPLLVVGVAVNGFAGGTYLVLTLWDHTRRTPRHPSPTVPSAPALSLVRRMRVEGDEMSADAAAYYLQMALDPYRYTVRASDRINPTSRAYSQSRDQLIAIPKKLSAAQVAVPIDLVVKSTLTNYLGVSGPEGRPLSPLSHAATVAHSWMAIRTLLQTLDPIVHHAIALQQADILRFLCLTDYREDDRAEATNLCQMITTEIQSHKTQANAKKVDLICGFLEAMISTRPLVVMIDPVWATHQYDLAGSRLVRIVIERRIVPILSYGQGRRERFSEWVRAQLGVRSVRISIPLASSNRARSYHLEVLGPEGTYLAAQRLIDSKGDWIGTEVPCKLTPRNGQRFSHLYVSGHRDARLGINARLSTAHYVASFFERPPGQVAAATLVAWGGVAVTLLAATARLVEGAVVESTDVVAILLSVPAALSAWLGLGLATPHCYAAVSRMLPLATLGFAIGASVLFLFSGSHDPVPFDQISEHALYRQWLALILGMSWVAIAGSISWFSRVAIYRHFVSRNPLSDLGIFEGPAHATGQGA
ncbi:hypothetical protein [Pimelobacter simplex]|uniref:hypothetical protein n=1 Tax=Nocardioides simplex TaxID=2045 RepID=UPI002150430A|nr:hypothetical protein [Pimelobacter simplex]UUW90436.1 hypothetical protein M0M43_02795 [Pimelobacter simplex]UUW94266.1 hypothetical protein M0M48_21310 [Pimelobacter simplex]